MPEGLLDFIRKSPVPYFAAEEVRKKLEAAGFAELLPGEAPARGGKYYVLRSGTALIALRLPREEAAGFVITAGHSDSPCFKIRDRAELSGSYLRLDAEPYGGPILASWMDRPLGIAGRVMVRTPSGARAVLIDMKKDAAIMPHMAPHLLRGLNEGFAFKPGKDLVALFAEGGAGAFDRAVADLAGCAPEDILARDLRLYCREQGTVWGPEGEYVSSPRLDDLAAVYTCTEGFLAAEETDRIQVLCVFDNEEICSRTRQGAGSDLLPRTLRAAAAPYTAGIDALLEQSFMISSDNAHAVHPNYPELFDANERVRMNGGPAVKHSPRYATDAVSGALFHEICRRKSIPVQDYANRPDLPGGSTIGNISAETTSVWTVDIGLPQLAMHSAYETIGSRDVDYAVRAVRAAYETRAVFSGDSFELR